MLAQGDCSANNIHIDVQSKANDVVRATSRSARLDNITVKSQGPHNIFAAKASDETERRIVATNWRVEDTSDADTEGKKFSSFIDRSDVHLQNWDITIDTNGTRRGIRINPDVTGTIIENRRVRNTKDEKVLILKDGCHRTNLLHNEFGGEFVYPDDAKAEDCLVIGNRIADDTILGDQSTWQGGFNFGYDL